MKEELIKLLGLGKTKKGLPAPPEPMQVPAKTGVSYAPTTDPKKESTDTPTGTSNDWTETSRTYHADKLVTSSDGYFTIKFKPVNKVTLQNGTGQTMTLTFLNV
jgi:hypothetical protein